ncbi:MAG TPA: hypothetical protein QGF27_10040 [Arenicellales bacterium]|nr:hypothetical protein [Arenicellales bacterium]MDP7219406.1 hypothetical protein [Arenicellales bacterium]HJP10354.1 hypothetical protein [Arenicellales bacterium]
MNRDRPEITWLGVDTRVTPALGENEQAATLSAWLISAVEAPLFFAGLRTGPAAVP